MTLQGSVYQIIVRGPHVVRGGPQAVSEKKIKNYISSY
jgi:hypothetical protein